MATDDTSTATTTEPAVPEKQKRDKVDSETFKKMLNILDDLLNHEHIFTDNYGSACQCQCACACQCRGIL